MHPGSSMSGTYGCNGTKGMTKTKLPLRGLTHLEVSNLNIYHD